MAKDLILKRDIEHHWQHVNVSGFNTLHVSSISMFFTMYRDISRKLASPIQVKNHGIWHFGYIHAQNQNV